MISKHKIRLKNGVVKTCVRIVEGYRPGPGLPPKQRQIKNFGYAENYEDQEAFWKMVQEEEDRFKASKEKISVNLDSLVTLRDTKRYMLGHNYLGAIFDFLELEDFCSGIVTRAKFDFTAIFKYLVCQRIIDPDSFRASFQQFDSVYGWEMKFDYHQIIRALDLIDENSEALQDHLNSVIKKKIGRQDKYLYYDTTNFYFETDYSREGKLPQKGVSKEHRTEPIVQYGLMIDSNKLPTRMMVFPGNTSDSTTYLPMIKALKDKMGVERLVTVADKGMNSSDNVSYIHFNGDGYVFSQILRGKKGTRYHTKMFEDDEFTWNEDRTYKYRIFDEDYEYSIKGQDGKPVKETAKRKVLIYWKKSIADREAHKREIKLAKAAKIASNNAYTLTHDATEYVSQVHVESQTGVVADKTVYSIDTDKAAEDAKFDGFFCIVTSELEYDKDKIHSVYGQLSHIEESFRISKSCLNERPMYVWTDSHIRAHLTICFTSLLMLRLLEMKMGDGKPSVERIQRALRSFGCEEIAMGVFRLNMDVARSEYKTVKEEDGTEITKLLLTDKDESVEDLLKIQKAFGDEFAYANVKQEKLNKHLKQIRFAITKNEKERIVKNDG